MITVYILEPEDVITEDSFTRPLCVSYENAYSDSVFFESCYGGRPINRMTWTETSRIAPAWIGKKVKEYNKKLPNEIFCLGNLPTSMITPLTKSEFESTIYKQYLDNLHIPFIKKFKLKGKSASYIKNMMQIILIGYKMKQIRYNLLMKCIIFT